MNKPYELFSHNPLPFSPPLASSFFTQTLIISSICPKITQLFPTPHTHAPAPTVLVYQCGIARGCAAPILITLGEHTCENRCPPGLACCSSLGWSVCVWLATTPPSPSPSFAQSFSGPQRAGLAPDTQTGRAHSVIQAGGRKHRSPGFTPCSVYLNISPAYR